MAPEQDSCFNGTPSPPLLSLPRELRDEIYTLALAKPKTIITMLPSHAYYANEISATQPPLTLTSRQLRRETLALFYSTNVFTAQLDHTDDLVTAKAWLGAIGDVNVGCLERLALCGWTRVPMGHMISRRWVKVVCDLKGGELEVEGGEVGHPDLGARVDVLKERFGGLVRGMGGRGWSAREVGGIMEGFYGVCAGYC